MRSQFYRTVGSDKPLESGHADDVLTMVIYNSPDEYQFNRQLYGYETNNGGIYIEGQELSLHMNVHQSKVFIVWKNCSAMNLRTTYREGTKFRDYGAKGNVSK